MYYIVYVSTYIIDAGYIMCMNKEKYDARIKIGAIYHVNVVNIYHIIIRKK